MACQSAPIRNGFSSWLEAGPLRCWHVGVHLHFVRFLCPSRRGWPVPPCNSQFPSCDVVACSRSKQISMMSSSECDKKHTSQERSSHTPQIWAQSMCTNPRHQAQRVVHLAGSHCCRQLRHLGPTRHCLPQVWLEAIAVPPRCQWPFDACGSDTFQSILYNTSTPQLNTSAEDPGMPVLIQIRSSHEGQQRTTQ